MHVANKQPGRGACDTRGSALRFASVACALSLSICASAFGQQIPQGANGTLSPDVYLKQTMPSQSPVYPTGMPYTYRGTEMDLVAFTTDEDKAAALIPKELQPIKIPQLPGQASALAVSAKYRENDQIEPYIEVIISLPVLYKGQLYLYVPYIYVDTDSAMTAGREFGGYPRKFANIQMRHFGSLFAWHDVQGFDAGEDRRSQFQRHRFSEHEEGGRLFGVPMAGDKSPELPFPYNLVLPNAGSYRNTAELGSANYGSAAKPRDRPRPHWRR